jgi:hypothetical protein
VKGSMLEVNARQKMGDEGKNGGVKDTLIASRQFEAPFLPPSLLPSFHLNTQENEMQYNKRPHRHRK